MKEQSPHSILRCSAWLGLETGKGSTVAKHDKVMWRWASKLMHEIFTVHQEYERTCSD